MKYLPPFRSLVALLACSVAGSYLHFSAATTAFAAPGSAGGKDELIVVSNVTTPRVAYDLGRHGNNLRLTLEVAGFDPASAAPGKDISVQVGVAADKEVRLTGKEAKVAGGSSPAKGVVRYEFTIPAASIVNGSGPTAEGWNKLRLAFAVEWAGAPGMPARLKASYLHARARASHAGLAAAASDWQPVDLAEMERQEADRAQEIAFDFEQVLDGKSTIVIENAEGVRVRNLVTAQSFTKGKQRIAWDGLDEKGNPALPGEYKWRAISHPGLAPRHQMSFVDAPGSNHGTLEAAVTNGTSLFMAATVAEGGHEIVEFGMDGTFRRGYNPPHGHGLKAVALAADGEYLYAAHEGTAWGDKIDRSKKNWVGANTLSLLRVNLANWNLEEFPNPAGDKAPKLRYATLAKYQFGPGSPGAKEDPKVLGGLACVAGRLYVGDTEAGLVRVVDPKTGAEERSFALAGISALAARGDALYALADGKLLKVDPTTGKSTQVVALEGKPFGLTIGADGRFYVSDVQDHIVRVLDAQGKQVGTIGKPGGIANGPYDPLRLRNPAGMAITNGMLWITERNRWTPKRYAAYDLATGNVVKEFYGPTNYGAQGAGFDPQDHTKWIGQGTTFSLNFADKTATPKSITGGESGRRHTWWRQDGRTFIITSGKATYIQELRDDGTLKPLAMASSNHQFAYSENWVLPKPFIEAFQRDFPDEKIDFVEGSDSRIARGSMHKRIGVMWVDRSGDGAMQADEIEFAPGAENMLGSGWSHDYHDLTLRFIAYVGGKPMLVAMKPDGFYPGGAPKYPPLNETVTKTGIPVSGFGPENGESAVDRFGNLIVSGSVLCAITPAGKVMWTYPNNYRGVHGSHKAPLPSVGEIQGALFFSGVVPLDDKSDVFLLNGNHGQAFVLTSDGLYVDAMFPDVRLMTNPQGGGIGVLGGECFGGSFGKSEKDGNYYFQGGGISYRIYRIDGLRELRRSEGALKLTAAQVSAAERTKSRVDAEKAQQHTAVIAELPAGAKISVDGRENDWKGIAPAVKWSKASNKFPVSIRAAFDEENLYLLYSVRDESPWVNNGKDWQSLFKTGDGVDLQIGTDSAASPRRNGPVAGDLRLFVAPSAAGDVAVLYRHRVPGAREDEGVVFQSPWRSEKVDVVRKLESAKVAVQRQGDAEYRVEISVPLAELGLKGALDKRLRGDFGVIYGDGEGTINTFRNYWNNQSTGLVNDVPGEIMLTPNLWGEVILRTSKAAGEAADDDAAAPGKSAEGK
ncbi:hypothetical protein DB346_12635 [Verrucomicrobia bacterium LW23]|nr:hypothetical protein DB346_12635 [Verrucomicrobia bacterium LW23]